MHYFSLSFQGMVPNVEDKLLFMKENLIKISKHRAMKQSNIDEQFAVLDLNTYKIIKRCIPLNIQEKSDLEIAQDSDVGEWKDGSMDPETGVEQAETGIKFSHFSDGVFLPASLGSERVLVLFNFFIRKTFIPIYTT